MTKPVSLETLQRLRPMLGLTLLGPDMAKTVNTVAAKGSRQADRKMMAKALARSDLGKAFSQHGSGVLLALLSS
eukprot:1568984-Amphidinium_carterae.1